ncbi:MAG: hypothetical protein WCN92_09350 [Eubacteriales bacterium]
MKALTTIILLDMVSNPYYSIPFDMSVAAGVIALLIITIILVKRAHKKK